MVYMKLWECEKEFVSVSPALSTEKVPTSNSVESIKSVESVFSTSSYGT